MVISKSFAASWKLCYANDRRRASPWQFFCYTSCPCCNHDNMMPNEEVIWKLGSIEVRWTIAIAMLSITSNKALQSFRIEAHRIRWTTQPSKCCFLFGGFFIFILLLFKEQELTTKIQWTLFHSLLFLTVSYRLHRKTWPLVSSVYRIVSYALCLRNFVKFLWCQIGPIVRSLACLPVKHR